jgi:hypothetical protein
MSDDTVYTKIRINKLTPWWLYFILIFYYKSSFKEIWKCDNILPYEFLIQKIDTFCESYEFLKLKSEEILTSEFIYFDFKYIDFDEELKKKFNDLKLLIKKKNVKINVQYYDIILKKFKFYYSQKIFI